ncbi:MAG TPA: hypothetical protein VF174_14915, partial [Micromonosporaceae bacterium]
DGRAGVRWIEIVPAGTYKVVLHEVLDLDEIADVYEFPDLAVHDKEYFSEILGMADDEARRAASRRSGPRYCTADASLGLSVRPVEITSRSC